MVLSLNPDLVYDGPIFDTHTHAVDNESLDLMVRIQKRFGVERAVLICHSPGAMRYAKREYPGHFVYAKYFSGVQRFTDGVDVIAKEIRNLKEDGYDLAKMQSAPVMRARAKADPDELRLHEDEMSPMFEALGDEAVPFILHLSDPDTYYSTRYSDLEFFGSKERDLSELEGVISRYPDVRYQIAHFAAQPEIHRLDNLGRWLDSYPNFNVDTSSARWLSRELSKDPNRASEFLTKYSNRIHFGTDCVAYTDDVNYYEGRYSALRLLLESDVRNMPLPFQDADTINSGGTQINGLSLEDSVLEQIYWKNPRRFYDF
ncbi:MAG: amidohydrolase family protein [Candidatus Thorarchaeota archaeon]|nr:MAG: amidohydrolase family protein [Candidatus Thorarchaeota archaeon]